MAYGTWVQLWWTEEDADYIRGRSARYPGTADLEPEWTQKVGADDEEA
jgi:hypothetical protein